jgi:hypothetical protein
MSGGGREKENQRERWERAGEEAKAHSWREQQREREQAGNAVMVRQRASGDAPLGDGGLVSGLACFRSGRQRGSGEAVGEETRTSEKAVGRELEDGEIEDGEVVEAEAKRKLTNIKQKAVGIEIGNR